MKNEKYLQYTFLHRYALIFVINKHIKDPQEKAMLLERAKWHDLDKAFLYTLIAKKDASIYHKCHSKHHFEPRNQNTSKEILDMKEAIMDYESAGYTKPDKPRNAYDTICDFDVQYETELLEILNSLGIKYSYQNTPNDPEWQAFLKTMPEITEELILKQIYEWTIAFPDEAKDALEYANSLS